MGDRTDANPKTRAMQASIVIFTRMHGASGGETLVPEGKLGLMPYSSSGIALGFTLKPVAGIVRQAMMCGSQWSRAGVENLLWPWRGRDMLGERWMSKLTHSMIS